MNGGSDHFDGLEHTPISEAVYGQLRDFSTYPNLQIMASSMRDNLKLSTFSPADLSSNDHYPEKAAMGIDLQPQLWFDSQQDYNSAHLMQEALHNPQRYNWAATVEDEEMKFNDHHQQQQQQEQVLDHQHDLYQQQQYNLHCFTSTSCAEPTPEFLNLLHLPGCSASTMLPGPPVNVFSELSMAQSVSASTDTVPYNQLNFTSEPPIFRDLFQTLPQTCSIPGSRAGSSFDGMDVRNANEGGDGRYFENSGLNHRRGRGEAKGSKHDAAEKKRRGQFNEKYDALRSLLPNPTKVDRTSIVSGAIEYINELQRTVEELKMLVKKKKIQRARSKRPRMEDGMALDMESSLLKPLADGEQTLNELMRSSWLIRKSKETVIDVRIIDDEVNIKLSQRRKANCLFLVSEVLDELQMELLHATGGKIGDYNIYMFNTKISEGSSVYASAIAQKLIESLDRQHLVIL